MTTVIESQRKAGGRRRVPAVTTPSLSQPSAVPPLPSLLLQYPTEASDGGGGGPLADLCSCRLTQLSACSQQLLGLLSPASPGEHLCCSGQPSEPSPAGNHLTVPRETSYSTGQPGSKHLCFFWNRTPGTGFFLHRHFPQFTEGRASQVLCHQPALLVQSSPSQAPN